MALTTVAQVLRLPGMANTAAIPTAWLTDIVAMADTALKKYVKRDLELAQYPGGPVYGGDSGYYSGNGTQDIILRQYPVWNAVTTIAAGSNGQALPQATINVASTTGFDPGNASTPPTISVQTGVNTYTLVTYTGTTATSFTGCSGGTGTMSSAATLNQVAMPVVIFDPNGYWGNSPTAFQIGTSGASGSLYVNGSQFSPVLDGSGTSNRGLLRRIGMDGRGFWPSSYGRDNVRGGKLAGRMVATWPFGQGNLKCLYSAGFSAAQLPADLSYACAMLVAQMARIQPLGTNVSSESQGQYNYAMLVDGAEPEMGTIRRILASYRDTSWPGGGG